MTVAEWAPLVDISEDHKEYLIKAELPELSKDDLRVTVENGTLILSGERKFEKEENTKKYHRIERSYGSFVRSFGLPDDADAEKVNAEFKDGVLKMDAGKNVKINAQQTIDVKAGSDIEMKGSSTKLTSSDTSNYDAGTIDIA